MSIIYRFEAKAGQEIGVQVQPVAGTKLEAVLQLIDADGRILDRKHEWIARLHLSRKPAFTRSASATASIAAIPA